jgi:hypothetical protein
LTSQAPGTDGSKFGVADEGRLAGLVTGRNGDRVGVGDAVEETVGAVQREGKHPDVDRASRGPLPRT